MVNNLGFLILAFIFNLGFSAQSRAANTNCTQQVLLQIAKAEEPGLLHKVQLHRQDLIKGYHLPENYASGYYSRRVEPYLSKPNYPEVINPKVLYRGMYLTPDELESILTKGMELRRVKWTSAGGGISFSSNMNEAMTYIFHSADSRPNGLGVVFEVKMGKSMVLADDPVLNATRTIFKRHSDLSSEEITNVYLWGEWGFESLDQIIEKAKLGKITPHENWTHAFDRSF